MKRRGLSEQILRANRVGYDPGPALLPRPRGLPRGGRAAVFPVLDSQSQAVYLQVRYLSPWEDRRYQSPTEELAGPSPRMTVMRVAGPSADPQTVLICEGFIDALSAAQAGYTSVAVLGASAPDETTARAVADRFPTQRLGIVFDDDPGGHRNATRLAELLTGTAAGDRVAVLRPQQGDLNGWLTADPQGFTAGLRKLTTTDLAVSPPAGGPQPSARAGFIPPGAPPGVGAVEL